MAETRRRGSWTTAIAVLAVVSPWLVGCGQTGQAQEASVVPSDARVAAERADRARVKGAEDAPIRIVEISDFQCPFCAQFYTETLPSVDSAYIATGRVSYVWISYPNPTHPLAWPAIEASFCAGAVGKFWPMHDLLFERQAEWTAAEDPVDTFQRYASELNIEAASFADCVRNDRMAPLQTRDYTNVVRSGIQSTPYFILADSVAIRGAADFETFRSAIDTLLAIKAGGGE